MDAVIFLYTTWPDAETAERAAESAVDEGLAACVNVLGPTRSIYRWQGVVEHASETPAVFKTTSARIEALKRLILARHPYDTPALMALPVDEAGSHLDFRAWIRREMEEVRS